MWSISPVTYNYRLQLQLQYITDYNYNYNTDFQSINISWHQKRYKIPKFNGQLYFESFTERHGLSFCPGGLNYWLKCCEFGAGKVTGSFVKSNCNLLWVQICIMSADSSIFRMHIRFMTSFIVDSCARPGSRSLTVRLMKSFEGRNWLFVCI